MRTPEYAHLNDDELLRIVLNGKASPLERELAYRLDALLDEAVEAEECDCKACQPELWS